MMRILLRSLLAILPLLLLRTACPALGGDSTIEIKNVPAGELKSAFFTVGRDLAVQIEAVGAQWETGDHMFVYPWIIDAHKRTLVWSMDEEFTARVKGSQWLRSYTDRVNLTPGTYELWFYAGRPGFLEGGADFEHLSDMLKALGRWLEDHRKDLNDNRTSIALAEKCFVRVTGDAGALTRTDNPSLPEPVIKLVHPGDDAYLSKGFSLARDADLQVYSVGEYSEGAESMVDWGWIIDAGTRERVWEMSDKNTDWAGGAEKNHRFRDRVHFPAGNYIAYFVTDDSHSPNGWNADPPYDPDGWGLQIFPVQTADRSLIRSFKESPTTAAIVRLAGIGDNELKSAAFRAAKPVRLRIYAIGEYDRFGDRMADYAWIVRAGRTEKVWSMTGTNARPAGGAEKNRLFDGVVPFSPGDYIVYYASDGSHSYAGGWNSSPPYDQKSYGVTIYPADSASDASEITPISQGDIPRPSLLAEITAVRSDEDVTKSFSLTSPTRVQIHAVGEGTRGGMTDYGWIENELTEDVVWEMTYRKTVHAGGADKNRVVDQTILLDKGDYIVHYETDGSHAFGDWNSAPPDDPGSWGITVTRAERTSE
jgi:hypothetical protein